MVPGMPFALVMTRSLDFDGYDFPRTPFPLVMTRSLDFDGYAFDEFS